MRYAFVSDVHGNLEALQAIFVLLDGQRIDRTVFLGDAVGYGANPNEVCDLLRGRAAVAILGNHDAAVSGRMDYGAYYEAARFALTWCAQRMRPENLAWLQAMPYIVREGDLAFCHGAPVVPELFDYLFSVKQVADLLGSFDELAPVTFIGHSHLAIGFRLHPGPYADTEAGSQAAPPTAAVDALAGGPIKHEPPAKLIITVGSVGQPRDRDPRACCGVFDTDTGIFDYLRTVYDVQTTRQKILDAGLPKMFGDRLILGM